MKSRANEEIGCYFHCLIQSAHATKQGKYKLAERYLDHATRSLRVLIEIQRESEELLHEQNLFNHHRNIFRNRLY